MASLTDRNTMRALLDRYGFHTSKQLGQNFLINPTVCPRIAELGGANEAVGVLEIGPGIGVLTVELAKRAKKVVAVELDERLLPILEETLSGYENTKVVQGDVLKLDLHRLIAEEFSGMDVVICANLPYYITTPVLSRLLEQRLPIRSITVMVQKEAAERLCADLGTKQARAITVTVRYFSEPKLLFSVSRGSFEPAPHVDSAVIRFDIRPFFEHDERTQRQFFRAANAAFAQRRKTVVNSVAATLGLNKAQLSNAMVQCNLLPTARAEQLTMEQFETLAQAITLTEERQ